MEDYLKKENPIKIENELVFINAFTSDIRKRIHGRCSHSHVTLNSFKNENTNPAKMSNKKFFFVWLLVWGGGCVCVCVCVSSIKFRWPLSWQG